MVHNADLPARSGLGSSSTFTVGFLNALYAMKNRMVTKRELALNAINLEQNIMGGSRISRSNHSFFRLQFNSI